MKKYKILSAYLVIIFGLIFLFNNNALATGAASFPQDTTFQLTIGSVLSNFTVVAGSDADSVVVNNDNTITVTISSGENFTMSSADSYQLNNDGGLNYTKGCSPSQTLLTIAPASAKTVIITPSSTQVGGCVGGGTTNNASGGGGSVVTTTNTPTPTPSTSSGPTPTPSSSVQVSPTPTSTPAVTVVKLVRKAGDSKVYVQKSDGTLTWVKTLQEFNTAGYRWSDIKILSAKDFAKLQTGPVTPPVLVGGKIKIIKGIKFLNIRSAPSLSGKIVGKIFSGSVVDYTSIQNGWYKINSGWVSGVYVAKVQ